MKAVRWADLHAELPDLVATCAGDADELGALLDRLQLGQEKLEQAIRQGNEAARLRIVAKLDELRADATRRDTPYRRLMVIRAMFVVRGVAGQRAGVAVRAHDMEIAAQ